MWKVHAEDKTHFHIQGNVGTFKVAKASLHPRMVQSMRLSCGGKVQKFDDGGEVEGSAQKYPGSQASPLVPERLWARARRELLGTTQENGESTQAPEPAQSPSKKISPIVSEDEWNKVGQDLGLTFKGAENEAATGGSDFSPGPTPEIEGNAPSMQKEMPPASEDKIVRGPFEGDISLLAPKSGPDYKNVFDPFNGDASLAAPHSGPDYNALKKVYGDSEEQSSSDRPLSNFQGNQPAPVEPPMGSPATKMGSGFSSPGDGGVLKAAKATAREQEKLGTIEEQNAQKLADQKEAAAQQDKQWIDSFNQDRGQRRTALNKMFDDYKNSKIDPEHFFADKSTFDKVRMGIGLLLSGIGSGLTGQPNLAIQHINNAIARDMDAQKANLGKTATLVGFYRDQMKDDQAGDLMAHAAMLNNVAAEMDAQATRLGGTADGQKLKIAASQTRMAGLAESDQASMRKVQVQKAQLDLQVERQSMAIRQKILSTGLGNLNQQEMAAAGMLGIVEPVQIDRHGTLGVARSKQDAEKLNTELPEWHAAQDILDQMQQLKEKEGRMISVPGSNAKQKFDGLQYQLGNSIEKATAGRVNSETLKGQIESMGGTIGRLYYDDPMAATREWTNAQTRALVNQHTWSRVGGSVAGSETPRAQGASSPADSVRITNGSQTGRLMPGSPMPPGWKKVD